MRGHKMLLVKGAYTYYQYFHPEKCLFPLGEQKSYLCGKGFINHKPFFHSIDYLYEKQHRKYPYTYKIPDCTGPNMTPGLYFGHS